MIYNIYHKTEFKYQNLVTFSHNIARLKPVQNEQQKLIKYAMSIEPHRYELNEFTDMFNNTNYHILIREAHQSLEVTATSKVEIFPEIIKKRVDGLRANSISLGDAIGRLSNFHADDLEAKRFLYESELIPNASASIKKYALESFHSNRDIFAATEEFMKRVFNDFEFVSGFSNITTPINQIFKSKKGVCQDFAQFSISALRSIGLPAKYMSGYIETLPQEGKEKLFGVDASHAWFAVYIPNAGWAEFDPTNNIVPKEQHILLGSGRDYNDISPLGGVVLSSGRSNLSVKVNVQREQTTP